jgi:hypothetical protein
MNKENQTNGGADNLNKKNKKVRQQYKNMLDFFDNYLSKCYCKKIDRVSTFWDPNWKEYFEAVAKIEALHISYEKAFLENSIAYWFVNFADPIMDKLMSVSGPFRNSGYEKKHGEDLPKILNISQDEYEIIDAEPTE